jgi:hypothetical protein
MGLEMSANAGLIERRQAEAEVIEVTAFAPWRPAAGAAEFTLDRHEVDQRSASTQLDEADVILAPLNGAAEHFAVKPDHLFRVGDAQHDVVDITYADHVRSIRAVADAIKPSFRLKAIGNGLNPARAESHGHHELPGPAVVQPFVDQLCNETRLYS